MLNDTNVTTSLKGGIKGGWNYNSNPAGLLFLDHPLSGIKKFPKLIY